MVPTYLPIVESTTEILRNYLKGIIPTSRCQVSKGGGDTDRAEAAGFTTNASTPENTLLWLASKLEPQLCAFTHHCFQSPSHEFQAERRVLGFAVEPVGS